MTAVIVDNSPIPAAFVETSAEHPAIAWTLANAEDLLVVSLMVVAKADYMLALPRLALRSPHDDCVRMAGRIHQSGG